MHEIISDEELAATIRRPDPIIIEAGCNDGTDTARFLKLFPWARVHCFEPEPRALARFKANPAMDDPRIRLYPVAVAALDDVIQFYPSDGVPAFEEAEIRNWRERLPDGWDYSGSIRRPKSHVWRHPWCKFGDPYDVIALRLDTWSQYHDVEIVDFLWADVQGAEGDLIEGAQELLKRTRYLYTEFSDEEQYEGQFRLEQILAALPNFRLIKQYTEDVLLFNTACEIR